MNKFLAAGVSLAILATPLAASAQGYRDHNGGYGRGDSYQDQRGDYRRGDDRRDFRGDDRRDFRGDDRRGWSGGRHYRARCYIRDVPVRGHHGRIFYRQVEVCRR